MSATRHVRIRYRWSPTVSHKWYRQVMGTVFGVGVLGIAALAIRQGSGSVLIGTVAAMSMLTLLLIYGVEVEEIRVSVGDNTIEIPFSVDRRGDDATDSE